eukprot:1625775-Rhodomonas_salina.2
MCLAQYHPGTEDSIKALPGESALKKPMGSPKGTGKKQQAVAASQQSNGGPVNQEEQLSRGQGAYWSGQQDGIRRLLHCLIHESLAPMHFSDEEGP